MEISVSESFAGPYLHEKVLTQLKELGPYVRPHELCLFTGSFAAQRRALEISNRAACYVIILDGPKVVVKASGRMDPVSDALLLNCI